VPTQGLDVLLWHVGAGSGWGCLRPMHYEVTRCSASHARLRIVLWHVGWCAGPFEADHRRIIGRNRCRCHDECLINRYHARPDRVLKYVGYLRAGEGRGDQTIWNLSIPCLQVHRTVSTSLIFRTTSPGESLSWGIQVRSIHIACRTVEICKYQRRKRNAEAIAETISD
jgi:hypothetical protein